MRSLYLCLLIATAPSWLAACGGGAAAEPPKDENDAVQNKSSGGSKDWSPSTSPNAATAPPSSAGVNEESAKKKASSDDLVAPTDNDPWMAPHQMPASDVKKVMKAANGKVNACWNAAKKRDPSFSGEVQIKFVITHEGSVRVWRNEDSGVSDEAAINCVGEVIKSLQFPAQKSPGDAWGIYKINFGG